MKTFTKWLIQAPAEEVAVACLIGIIALTALLVILGVYTADDDWLKGCAQHRPLVECRQDLVLLTQKGTP